LGWVHIFYICDGLGWAGSSVDGLGRVGSPKMDARTTPVCVLYITRVDGSTSSTPRSHAGFHFSMGNVSISVSCINENGTSISDSYRVDV